MTNQAVQNILVNQPTFAEILRRFGPDPMSADPDCSGLWYSACRGMFVCEEEWRRRRRVFCWIDQEPTWISAAYWYYPILQDPERPCVRRFRLSLLGGGQIKVTENFVWSVSDGLLGCGEPKLEVWADTVMGVRVCRGVLSHGSILEMSAYAVVFPRGTSQEIADRTAATLRLIGDHPDNFYALLSRGQRCGCCSRPLKDEISMLLGIGPDCAQAMGMPHNIAFTDRILARRRELLGGSSS
jgi:hypothetical protein